MGQWQHWVQLIRGVDPFQLAVEHFPESTRAKLPLEAVLRFGILPLGLKRKTKWFHSRQYLNVGALDLRTPGLAEAVERLGREALGSDYGGYQLYRLAGPAFLRVLSEIYRVSLTALANRPAGEVNPAILSAINAEAH